MINPYQVLGVSPTASDDEVKRVYRALSRKYHPDANVNNPNKKQAEERFKEIQQAYQMVMDEREAGGMQGKQIFSGFEDFSDQQYYRNTDSEEYQMHLRAAANYIQNGYFMEADNVLRQMEERTGGWYYLSAVANAGMGNNIMALEHARTAVLLEPNSVQYQQLVAQLESGGSWYQQMHSPYQNVDASDCCMQLCFTSALCNLCFGGSYYCNSGYGPFC